MLLIFVGRCKKKKKKRKIFEVAELCRAAKSSAEAATVPSTPYTTAALGVVFHAVSFLRTPDPENIFI